MSAGGTQRSCKREQTSMLDLPSAAEPRQRQPIWQRMGVMSSGFATLISAFIGCGATSSTQPTIAPNPRVSLRLTLVQTREEQLADSSERSRASLKATLGYSSETTKSETQQNGVLPKWTRSACEASKLACFSERQRARGSPKSYVYLAQRVRCKPTPAGGFALATRKITTPSGLAAPQITPTRLHKRSWRSSNGIAPKGLFSTACHNHINAFRLLR